MTCCVWRTTDIGALPVSPVMHGREPFSTVQGFPAPANPLHGSRSQQHRSRGGRSMHGSPFSSIWHRRSVRQGVASHRPVDVTPSH